MENAALARETPDFINREFLFCSVSLGRLSVSSLATGHLRRLFADALILSTATSALDFPRVQCYL
jgi:hypothetical protein